jgi:hypothetical protein
MFRRTFLLIVAPLVALLATQPAQAQQQQAAQSAAQETQQVSIINVFSIQGLSNESGQLDWPTVFKTMPHSAEVKTLREQINAQFLAIMIQRTSQGQSDPKLIAALRTSLHELRVRLNESRGLIPHGTFVEGNRYLRRLVAAEKMLE